jgi:hypothetical protein
MEANVSPARESRYQLRASNGGLSHSEGLFRASPTSTQDAQPEAFDRDVALDDDIEQAVGELLAEVEGRSIRQGEASEVTISQLAEKWAPRPGRS